MVAQPERMLKKIPQTPIINIKTTLDHCRTTISQLKFLQMLIATGITQTMTVHKQSRQLILPGEAQIQMFL